LAWDHAQRALARAETAVGHAHRVGEPPRPWACWLDLRDWEALCAARAERPGRAEPLFREVLTELPPGSGRARSGTLLNLAEILAPHGDPGEAAAHTLEALGTTAAARSAFDLRRVRHLSARLTRRAPQEPAVRVLSDALNAVG
jgi:hypothetical protein